MASRSADVVIEDIRRERGDYEVRGMTTPADARAAWTSAEQS